MQRELGKAGIVKKLEQETELLAQQHTLSRTTKTKTKKKKKRTVTAKEIIHGLHIFLFHYTIHKSHSKISLLTSSILKALTDILNK